MKKGLGWLVVVVFLLTGLVVTRAQATMLPEPETVQPEEQDEVVFKTILDLFGRTVNVPASTPDRDRFGPPAIIKEGDDGYVYFIFVAENKVAYVEAYTPRHGFLISVGWSDGDEYRIVEDVGLGTPILTGVLVFKERPQSEEKEEDHPSPPKPKPIANSI